MPANMDKDVVAGHARFFDHLVELIPAKFYYDDEDRVDLLSMKKAERLAAKQEFKEKARQNKRAKLDPDAAATTLDVQRRKLEEQRQQVASGSGRPTDDAQDDEEGAAGASGRVAAAGAAIPASANLSGGSASRAELLERLHQKIEDMRKGRPPKDKQPSQKASGKDRQAAAQKAKEWRQKTLQENAKQKQQEQHKQDGKKKADGQQQQHPAGDNGRQQQGKQQPAADNDFQFAKIELDDGKRGHSAAGRGRKAPSKAELLKVAEAKQREQQETAGTKEGKVKQQQEAWRSALARAGGERVLDDPKLLKKSLKKEAKRREKSAKAWQERKKVQDDVQASRQQKRQSNLQSRVEKKVEKKIAKREKKLLGSGNRAGFEGRKQGFINKGKSGGGAKV